MARAPNGGNNTDGASNEGPIDGATTLALQAVRRALASDLPPDEHALERLMFKAVVDALPGRPDPAWCMAAIEERPELLELSVAGGPLRSSIRHAVEILMRRSILDALQSPEKFVGAQDAIGTDDTSPARWHR